MNPTSTLESPDAAPRTSESAEQRDHRRDRHIALAVLLVGTAALYLWDLGSSDWANAYYSAAAQAGSASWKAFFFGSLDSANSITVDKTPLALWPMALSVRLFGLSSWSILVPQALIGVGSVALLHATVRRSTGNAWAGLLAGLILALTPVAALMFRFNNPDALLVLLLIGSVYATLRALETPERAVRWLVLGGAMVALAFLTKMLQAFLVLPALVLVYLVAATAVPLGRRVAHLLIAFGSMIVAAGWWVAIVELWPAASRPYIGGSQDNSVLELTLGYNGFGRLSGNEVGSVGGGQGPGGGNAWGQTGVLRMFSSEVGGQVAWLLPAALVLLGLGLWFLLRRGRATDRTDTVFAGLVVWGTWLIVTGLTFSLMAGIFHAYYTVALAPAIAAVVAIGAHVLWRNRDSGVAVLGAALSVSMTAAVSFWLLARTPDFVPWLRYLVIVAGVIAGSLLALARFLPRRAVVTVAAATLVAVLAGPAAYAVDTVTTAHEGSIPSAGPSSPGGPGGRGGPGGLPQRRTGGPQGTPPNGPANGPGAGQANAGGLLTGSQSSAELTALLSTDADTYTWVAAAVGANSAAGYQLATELPVLAIGGFNGSDPSPTLDEFKQLVADGEIHYFVAAGRGGGPGGPGAGGGASSDIASWVQSTFTAQTVDGITVYDLKAGVR